MAVGSIQRAKLSSFKRVVLCIHTEVEDPPRRKIHRKSVQLAETPGRLFNLLYCAFTSDAAEAEKLGVQTGGKTA